MNNFLIFFRRIFLSIVFAVSITPILISTAYAQNTTSNMVLIKTNFGEITVELYSDKAPVTTENFIKYVKSGFYNNTIFHRVINNFMIQGGGFEPGMKQKQTNSPIQNEANNGLKNETYTLAMARTNDAHSATAQFFINVENNEFLNHKSPTSSGWGYCVFGKVIKGTEVIDKIKAVKTGRSGFHQDVPVEDVIIQSATLI